MLEITRGDDVELEFTFVDNEGIVIDVSECDIFFTVKKNATDVDDDALIIKDFETTAEEGTEGVLSIWLDAGDTTIETGVYSYDLQVKDDDGYVFSSTVGKLLVKRDITRRTVLSI